MSQNIILVEEYKALIAERLVNIRERKILEKSAVVFSISCYAFFARFSPEIDQKSIKLLILFLPIGLTVASWLRYSSYGDYNRRIVSRVLEIEAALGSLDSFHAQKAPFQKKKFFRLGRVYWATILLCSMIASLALASETSLISIIESS